MNLQHSNEVFSKEESMLELNVNQFSDKISHPFSGKMYCGDNALIYTDILA